MSLFAETKVKLIISELSESTVEDIENKVNNKLRDIFKENTSCEPDITYRVYNSNNKTYVLILITYYA